MPHHTKFIGTLYLQRWCCCRCCYFHWSHFCDVVRSKNVVHRRELKKKKKRNQNWFKRNNYLFARMWLCEAWLNSLFIFCTRYEIFPWCLFVILSVQRNGQTSRCKQSGNVLFFHILHWCAQRPHKFHLLAQAKTWNIFSFSYPN